MFADPNQYGFGFDVDGKSHMISMARRIERPVQSLVLNGQNMVETFDREGAVVRIVDPRIAGKSVSFQHERSWRMRDEQTNSSWDLWVIEAVSGNTLLYRWVGGVSTDSPVRQAYRHKA